VAVPRAFAGRDVERPQPNVIVILSDTHRYDYVSFRPGLGEDITPNIRALGEDGVRFTRFYTVIPISAPAYASLFTGVSPLEHGVLNNAQRLSEGLPVLAEWFQVAGYETAAVVGNGFCGSRYGFARGFDYFWDEIKGAGKEGEVVTNAAVEWLEKRGGDKPFFLFVAYMDAHTPFIFDGLEPCLRLQLNDDEPLLLSPENVHVPNRVALRLQPGRNRVTFTYLENLAPATPKNADSPLRVSGLWVRPTIFEREFEYGFRELDEKRHRLANEAVLVIRNPEPTPRDAELIFRSMRMYAHDEHARFYLESVRAVDRAFGRLRDVLRGKKLYDDAVVVFLSDHGEMLGEHKFWGHINSLHEEDMRCPLVVKAPGLPKGTICTRPMCIMDLREIITDMLTSNAPVRQPAPDGWPFAGEPASRGTIPFMTFPPEAKKLRFGLIRDNKKTIADFTDETFELYDLHDDSSESRNLFRELSHTDEIKSVMGVLQSMAEKAAAMEHLDLEQLAPENIEQLRALGYVE
jgi:arylsulfatase A-like enzyme